jgi:Competence protein
MRVSDLIAGTITVSLMISYAFVTALGAPVWRAMLMLAVYLGSRLLYREKSMLNAIGAAALALMIVNPRVLFGASFQLTFLCVWLVAAVGIPIFERTTQPFARGAHHIDSISVGARNTYGHPRREVLARLAEAHVLTYRTDLDGAVTFFWMVRPSGWSA